jgi:hypothetical protein
VPSGIEIGIRMLRAVRDEAEIVALTEPISTRFTTSSDDPSSVSNNPGEDV